MVNAAIQALASVPRNRDVLNSKDADLSSAIRRIEAAIVELRPGISAEITYATEDGHRVLSFGKWNMEWRLWWGSESDAEDDVPLLSAPRQARAEIFAADELTKLSPMDRLVIELSHQLVEIAKARDRFLVVAARLASVLETAVVELPR